jgi:hypothetical protein
MDDQGASDRKSDGRPPILRTARIWRRRAARAVTTGWSGRRFREGPQPGRQPVWRPRYTGSSGRPRSVRADRRGGSGTPTSSRLTVPGNSVCCPDEVRSMLPATNVAAARPPGRRPRSRPAGRRPFLTARPCGPPTPPCQDRHAAAQHRSPRPQLAGRQLRQTHPRGGPRDGRVGRRAASRGLRPPGPAKGRPARRYRLRAGQPDPGWRPPASTAAWSPRRWSRWTGACWWSWRSATVPA